MYKIIKFTDLTFLNKCKKLLFDICYSTKNVKLQRLEDIHQCFKPADVNEFRMECFEKINKLKWEEQLLPLLSEEITRMCGPDYMIQSKLNLSIVMPHDKNSTLSGHSDSWSGDSPFQINFWIPLTSTLENNGLFILNAEKSFEVFESIDREDKFIFEEKMGEADFISTNFGECIVFNPLLIHGSVENITGSTRVSLNIRAKNLFAPDLSEYFPDRNPFTYYKTRNISSNTSLGLKYLSLLKKSNRSHV